MGLRPKVDTNPMIPLILTNRTHHTQITLLLKGDKTKDIKLSKGQTKRVRGELCGMGDCLCNLIDRAYLDGSPARLFDDGEDLWVALKK